MCDRIVTLAYLLPLPLSFAASFEGDVAFALAILLPALDPGGQALRLGAVIGRRA